MSAGRYVALVDFDDVEAGQVVDLVDAQAVRVLLKHPGALRRATPADTIARVDAPYRPQVTLDETTGDAGQAMHTGNTPLATGWTR